MKIAHDSTAWWQWKHQDEGDKATSWTTTKVRMVKDQFLSFAQNSLKMVPLSSHKPASSAQCCQPQQRQQFGKWKTIEIIIIENLFLLFCISMLVFISAFFLGHGHQP